MLIDRAASDEGRKNAQAALSEIDTNRATGPSYITLHVRNAPPARVIAEISRQCFAPLPTMPENLWGEGSFPNLTLDFDHRPFWEVMPVVCDKLGIDFRPYGNTMRLMRTGGMHADGITGVSGAFLVVATGINYTRSKSFVRQGAQTRFGMNLTVLPEPKLKVLRGGGMVSLDEAVDENGNSLVPKTPSPEAWGGFGGFAGWNLYVPLVYPKNIGTRIARLKGFTSFIIQTESENVEIPDLSNLKATTRVVNNMRATFDGFKKSADTWELHVHVDQPNFGGPDWQQFMEGAQNRLAVLDENGVALDRRGTSTSVNNTTVDLTLTFARSTRPDGRSSGPPARMVWEVPTKTQEIRVPIRFENLPLFDDK